MNENLKDIDRRINDHWSNGRYTDAGRVIADELLPVIVDNLIGKRGFSKEEAEDVAGEAREAFLKKISENGPLSIKAPKPYIWRSAERRAVDHIRKKATLPQADNEPLPGPDGEEITPQEHFDNQSYGSSINGVMPAWQARAMYMAEALIVDIEIDPSVAVRLVNETLTRLAPINAQVLRHLLDHGLNQPAADAARAFGMTANNFGVRKNRAYKEFREIAPKVAVELGVQWRGVTEEPPSADAVETPEFVPSEDDEQEQQENGV